MEIWVWTAIIAVTLVLEFLTAEFISIWFSVSAVVSLVLAILKVPTWVNVLVFCLLSLVLLLSLRKLCYKLLKSSNEKTNTESLIGTKTKLLTSITKDDYGTLKISGITWNVIAQNKENIEKDTEVEIVAITGNKLIVKKGE